MIGTYGTKTEDTEQWADQLGIVTDTPPLKAVQHAGQLHIAERFRDAYSDKFLFVHGIGWHAWGGTHWVEDKDGAAERAVVELFKALRREAADLPTEQRDRLYADVKRCESAAGVSGVLGLAKTMLPIATGVARINADPVLFNGTNGTLNLETGKVQPHNPRDMITKCAGCAIEPDARSDLWEAFLDEVLPDAEVRAYLARVFGLAMLGAVREHTLPILTGTGGNGKGVCVDAVLAAFDTYGLVVDPKLIIASRTERHGTFMADLHGARLVVTSETDDGDLLAAATVKRLTGGDKIRANRMRSDPFEFTPSHTLVMHTNHAPRANGDDKALWRRLRVVPFDVTVERPDGQLGEKLRAHLPAVLAWCLSGWFDYVSDGMRPPRSVTEATEEYRAEGDPLGRFLAEECVTGPSVNVMAKPLYEAWQAWQFRQSGIPPMTMTDFGKRVSMRFEKKTTARGAKYVGVALASSEQEAPGML